MTKSNLDVVLKEYIEECPDFKYLQDDDKIFIYSSLKKILNLLHLVIKYPNVSAILFVQSQQTKRIIEEAFKAISPVIPSILNIKITIMH